jgi:hypothetical protein
MASALVLASIWAAICMRDPEHPGCALRPGQCAELSDGTCKKIKLTPNYGKDSFTPRERINRIFPL